MKKLALNRLNLWQKLGAMVLAQLVPAVLVAFFFLTTMGGELSQVRGELQGVRFLQAIGTLRSNLLTHGARAYVFASGDTARRAAVAAEQREVDTAMSRLDGVSDRLGELYGVTEDVGMLGSQWSAAVANLAHTPSQIAAANAALIARLNQLAAAVAAGSRIASDSDQTSRTLLEIGTEFAPAALARADDMRRFAVDAASKSYLGGDDQMGIAIYRARVLSQFDRIRAGLAQLPPQVSARLQSDLETAVQLFGQFDGVVDSQIVKASSLKTSGGAIYDSGIPASHALQKLAADSLDAASSTLRGRASSVAAHRDLAALLALLALGVALALARLVRLSLSRPLTRAIGIFEHIAQGRYDNQIETRREDEAGQVLRALAVMQDKLRGQIEKERVVAAENSRVRHALDKASTCVVLADVEHRIIYLNDAALATFERHAAEMRSSLPAFDAARLRGSSLDTLSANPAGERRVLDTLSGERVEERALGGLTFRTVTNPVTAEHGERLGTVMEWTQRTQEVRVEEELQRVLDAVNGGDLSRRIDLAHKSGFFEGLGAGVNRLAESLVEIVSRVKSAGREIALGADEITAGNSNLSLRTEEQASSLEETASSMEEMTTTVKQNADNAAQANQLALAARDQAEQGGAVVGNAVAAMSEINESAKKIADIIGVIDEIAFQTNLLALNAAVEAARAGEQGRGFAVVASEVRSLAGRSATAAKEIKSLIEDSVRKVGDGSSLVTRSGRTLGEIVTSVKKVSDIVAEIAAASREQSSGIEQVNRAVVQMDELTQQNAALVEQASAASQAMSGQVRELNEMLARYDTGVESAASPVAQQPPASLTSGVRNAPPPARGKARPDTRRAAGGEWIEV
ncbi:MAG TPA: methyl-accepting chemotaxis protein [Steroidobacteraceae bacterium]|jgi:methyl-accepting chemotaxis protein|nr:methyl-accepting chemotaxis protein [Steroidobacteraceae bacterium]